MSAPDSPNTKLVQLELFLPLPDFSDVALRDYQETMQRPFFSLTKKRRIKPIESQSPDGKVSVHVSANPAYGMATIWDADILIFLASAIQEKKRKQHNRRGARVCAGGEEAGRADNTQSSRIPKTTLPRAAPALARLGLKDDAAP